eukprot:UC4_evm1s160
MGGRKDKSRMKRSDSGRASGRRIKNRKKSVERNKRVASLAADIQDSFDLLENSNRITHKPHKWSRELSASGRTSGRSSGRSYTRRKRHRSGRSSGRKSRRGKNRSRSKSRSRSRTPDDRSSPKSLTEGNKFHRAKHASGKSIGSRWSQASIASDESNSHSLGSGSLGSSSILMDTDSIGSASSAMTRRGSRNSVSFRLNQRRDSGSGRSLTSTTTGISWSKVNQVSSRSNSTGLYRSRQNSWTTQVSDSSTSSGLRKKESKKNRPRSKNRGSVVKNTKIKGTTHTSKANKQVTKTDFISTFNDDEKELNLSEWASTIETITLPEGDPNLEVKLQEGSLAIGDQIFRGSMSECFFGSCKGEKALVWGSRLDKTRNIQKHEFRRLSHAAALLIRFKHRHVLRVLGVCTKHNIIALEFAEQGHLDKVLRENDLVFSQGARLRLAKEISWALWNMDLEANGQFTWGDVATRNVLLRQNGSCAIYNMDIGEHTGRSQNLYVNFKNEVLTRWIPPGTEETFSQGWTIKSDVWQFGLLLYELWSGAKIPYGKSWFSDSISRSTCFLLQKGQYLPKPINCPPEVYDIILSCWKVVPDDRPSFESLHKVLLSVSEFDLDLEEYSTEDEVIDRVLSGKFCDQYKEEILGFEKEDLSSIHSQKFNKINGNTTEENAKAAILNVEINEGSLEETFLNTKNLEHNFNKEVEQGDKNSTNERLSDSSEENNPADLGYSHDMIGKKFIVDPKLTFPTRGVGSTDLSIARPVTRVILDPNSGEEIAFMGGTSPDDGWTVLVSELIPDDPPVIITPSLTTEDLTNIEDGKHKKQIISLELHRNAVGDLSAIKPEYTLVGKRVKVKSGITPSFGWGSSGVNPSMEGIIQDVFYDDHHLMDVAVVKFTGISDLWKASCDDLEDLDTTENVSKLSDDDKSEKAEPLSNAVSISNPYTNFSANVAIVNEGKFANGEENIENPTTKYESFKLQAVPTVDIAPSIKTGENEKEVLIKNLKQSSFKKEWPQNTLQHDTRHPANPSEDLNDNFDSPRDTLQRNIEIQYKEVADVLNQVHEISSISQRGNYNSLTEFEAQKIEAIEEFEIAANAAREVLEKQLQDKQVELQREYLEVLKTTAEKEAKEMEMEVERALQAAKEAEEAAKIAAEAALKAQNAKKQRAEAYAQREAERARLEATGFPEVRFKREKKKKKKKASSNVDDLNPGDRVKVKMSVKNPKYGWTEGVTHKSLGNIKSIDENGTSIVKFDNLDTPWICLVNEIEKCTSAESQSKEFRVGSRVMMIEGATLESFVKDGVDLSESVGVVQLLMEESLQDIQGSMVLVQFPQLQNPVPCMSDELRLAGPTDLKIQNDSQDDPNFLHPVEPLQDSNWNKKNEKILSKLPLSPLRSGIHKKSSVQDKKPVKVSPRRAINIPSIFDQDQNKNKKLQPDYNAPKRELRPIAQTGKYIISPHSSHNTNSISLRTQPRETWNSRQPSEDDLKAKAEAQARALNFMRQPVAHQRIHAYNQVKYNPNNTVSHAVFSDVKPPLQMQQMMTQTMTLPQFSLPYPGILASERGTESNLTDDQFLKVFKMDKNSFYLQPKWKQIQQKRNAGLF